MTGSRVVGIAAVVISGAVAGLAPVPAQASTVPYVALGDSYSAGGGTRGYLSDGTTCQRSVYAYPSLLASSKGYALSFRACSGATTADVAALQLGALSGDTAYVTITVGGNDVGFADVLTECAKPAWMSSCTAAVDKARTIITSQMPGRLASLYAAIRARASRARVVVAGYPRMFNGVDCNAGTWFSSTEMSRLNSSADLLNSTMATAARNAGFGFTNPTAAFTGHAVCAGAEWVNGLSHPTTESYHPNRQGHVSGYTPLVASAITGTTVTVTAGTLQRSAASAERLSAAARAYAALDRTIERRAFVPPDLSSAEARSAAARAGVDLGSRTSIDAADRRHEALESMLRRGEPG